MGLQDATDRLMLAWLLLDNAKHELSADFIEKMYDAMTATDLQEMREGMRRGA